RSAGPSRFVGQNDRDENAEAERGDGEIMPLQPEDRPADQERDERRKRGPSQDAKPGRNAKMRRSDGGCVGSYAEKAGMAKAHLAGKSHQQIQADRGESKHEDERAYAVVIGGRKKQREQDDDRGDDRDRCEPVLEQRAHVHTRSTPARPSRPCGTRRSTTRMTRNATASL